MKKEKNQLNEAKEELFEEIDKLLVSRNLKGFEVENFRISKKKKKKCYKKIVKQVRQPDGSVKLVVYRKEVPC